MTGCLNGESDSGKFHASAVSLTDMFEMEMVKLLIEDQTEYTVEIHENLYEGSQTFDALDRGQLDFASFSSIVAYDNELDDLWSTIPPDETLEQARNLYEEGYDIKWYDSVGYTLGHSIATGESYAEENGIETISDLEPYADELILGMTYTWMDRLSVDHSWLEDGEYGYEAVLQEDYGFQFAYRHLQESVYMYDSIGTHKADVFIMYTLDPYIDKYDLKLLEDDQNHFPNYPSSIVVSNETIENYPEIDDILKTMTNLINSDEMAGLIYEFEDKEQPIEVISEEFLRKKGMLD